MIREKKRRGKPVVDLTGPDGNVFALMGNVSLWSKQLGIDSVPIIKEMMESDYENAIDVIEKYFGNYVILER